MQNPPPAIAMIKWVVFLFLNGLLFNSLVPIAAFAQSIPSKTHVAVRSRLIIDNDFGGDPDGLFALAHHLLSPSMDIRGIIGSINYKNGFFGAPGTADYSCEVVTNLLKSMGLDRMETVCRGADSPLRDLETPEASDGAKLIVREAMRSDTTEPLYIACGAGLTDIASAYLMEPRIAHRVQLIWIGGGEYAGLGLPPPGQSRLEYNLGIDPKAAKVIFNVSDIPLWQVPRSAYRQVLVSYAELRSKIAGQGSLGTFLLASLDRIRNKANGSLGETYILGDSPLVLLTALQSPWEPDASSSQYVLMSAPKINDGGGYQENPAGRKIRVYTRLDVRLTLEDFYAKVSDHHISMESGASHSNPVTDP